MHRKFGSILLLLAACSTAPAGTPDAGDAPDAATVESGPVEATTYCEAIAPFFCRFYLRCDRIAADDTSSCLSLFAESCEGKYEPHYAGLARAGLIELRREGIAACEAHLDSVSCDDQVLDLDGPCASMWVGKQTEGNVCGFDVETFACAPGTRCALDLSLCGTCKRVVGIGETCEGGNVSCATDATCSEGKCVKRAKAGEACAGFADCALGLSCGDDSTCHGPSRSRVGGSCDQTHRCPYGSTCVSGTCRAQARSGERCDPAIGCVGGRCDGTCVGLLAGQASCTASSACESGMCLSGRCDAVPGHCFIAE